MPAGGGSASSLLQAGMTKVASPGSCETRAPQPRMTRLRKENSGSNIPWGATAAKTTSGALLAVAPPVTACAIQCLSLARACPV